MSKPEPMQKILNKVIESIQYKIEHKNENINRYKAIEDNGEIMLIDEYEEEY